MDLLGSKIGGIQTFIKNFIKYAPDDFDIELIGVSSDKENRPVGKWQNIKIYDKNINFLPVLYVKDENVRPRIPLSLKFALALLKYKKLFDCNSRILSYHRIESSLSFINRPARHLLFIHNNMIDLLYSPLTESKWRKFPSFYFHLEKRVIGKMDKVFVVIEDVVKFYREKYPFMADRFSFLPTWVDEETFSPYENEIKVRHKTIFSKSKNFPPNAKLILFVGRLEGAKDPLLLIDAFNYINKHAPQTRMLIVGKGLLKRKMLSKVEKYGLKEKVLFFGNLSQDKIAELMKISDVFLLTSAFEGMPMGVLEALACGLPVVSADVGEVKRTVRDGFSGLICSKRSADIIGNAVLKILKEKKISIENCLSSIKDYTAGRVLSEVYEVYRNLGAKR